MAANEFKPECKEIGRKNVESGSKIPEFKAVVIRAGREPRRRREIGEVAAGIRHTFGSEGPCQVVVTESDPIGQR